MVADKHVSARKKTIAVKHVIILWVLKPVLSMLKEKPANIAIDSDQEE